MGSRHSALKSGSTTLLSLEINEEARGPSCGQKLLTRCQRFFKSHFSLERWRWAIQAMSSGLLATCLTTVPPIEAAFQRSGYWALTAATTTLEPTVGGSLKKGAERALATVMGGFIGYGVFALITFHDRDIKDTGGRLSILALLLLMPIPWGYVRLRTQNRPWFANYGLMTSILVIGSAYVKGGALRTASMRTLAVFSGVCIGTLVSRFVLPTRARDEARKRLIAILEATADILGPILELEAGAQSAQTHDIMKPTRKILEDIAARKHELKILHAAAHRHHENKRLKMLFPTSNEMKQSPASQQGSTQESSLVPRDSLAVTQLQSTTSTSSASSILASLGFRRDLTRKRGSKRANAFGPGTSRVRETARTRGQPSTDPTFELVDLEYGAPDPHPAKDQSEEVLQKASPPRCEYHHQRSCPTSPEASIPLDPSERGSSGLPDQLMLGSPAISVSADDSQDSHRHDLPRGGGVTELCNLAQGVLDGAGEVEESFSSRLDWISFRHGEADRGFFCTRQELSAAPPQIEEPPSILLGGRESSMDFARSRGESDRPSRSQESESHPLSYPAGSSSSLSNPQFKSSLYNAQPRDPRPTLPSKTARDTSIVSCVSQYSTYFQELEEELDSIRLEMMQEATGEYARVFAQEEAKRQERWTAVFAHFARCQNLLSSQAALLMNAKQEWSCRRAATFFPYKKFALAVYHVQFLFHYVTSLYFSLDYQMSQFSQAQHDTLQRLSSTTGSSPASSARAFPRFSLYQLHHWTSDANNAGHSRVGLSVDRDLVISEPTRPASDRGASSTEVFHGRHILIPKLESSIDPLLTDKVSRVYAGLNAAFSWTEAYGALIAKSVMNVRSALRSLASCLEKNEDVVVASRFVDYAAEHLDQLTAMRTQQRQIYSKIFTIAMVADKTGQWDTRSTYSIEWEALTGLHPKVFLEMTESEHDAFWNMYWKGRDRLSISTETLQLLTRQLYRLCRVIQSIVMVERRPA